MIVSMSESDCFDTCVSSFSMTAVGATCVLMYLPGESANIGILEEGSSI